MAAQSNGSATREEHYRELLAEHARSGLTLKSFAERHRLVYSTLAWWKHVISHRRGDRRSAPKRSNGVAPVVPVRVVAGAFDRRASSGGPEFVVELRSGRVLRVPRGFDAEELRVLVGILESAC